MKFAFLILDSRFDSAADRASIHGGDAQIIGVASLAQAAAAARQLAAAGVDCIELCGAFGPEGARAVIDAIPVGYVTHLPEQDSLYTEVFG